MKKILCWALVFFSCLAVSEAGTKKKMIRLSLEVNTSLTAYRDSEDSQAAFQLSQQLCKSEDATYWSYEAITLGANFLVSVTDYFQGGIFFDWAGINAQGASRSYTVSGGGYTSWYYNGGAWWGYDVPSYVKDECKYKFVFPTMAYGVMGRAILPIIKEKEGPFHWGQSGLAVFGEVRLGTLVLSGAKYQFSDNSIIQLRDEYSGKSPYLSLGGGLKILGVAYVGVRWNKAFIDEVNVTTKINDYDPDAVGYTGILTVLDGSPLKMDFGGMTYYVTVVIPLFGFGSL